MQAGEERATLREPSLCPWPYVQGVYAPLARRVSQARQGQVREEGEAQVREWVRGSRGSVNVE